MFAANERYADCCVQEREHFSWGSLMAFEWITVGQKTDMVVIQGNLNAPRYIDEVLRPHTIPFLCNQGLCVTFQCVSARPHTALIKRPFLSRKLTFSLGLPCSLISTRLSMFGTSRVGVQGKIIRDLQTALI